MKCYYDDLKYCDYTEELWQCETCNEWFCAYHWHETTLGHCVECAACEYARKEREANKVEKHRWAHPYDWFCDWIDKERDAAKLRSYLKLFAVKLYGDDIQNLFEKEMDEDGFFEPEAWPGEFDGISALAGDDYEPYPY